MKTTKAFRLTFCLLLLAIASSAQLNDAPSVAVKPLTFEAVDAGDLVQLKALIGAGANVNATYENITLLIWACSVNGSPDVDIINALLDAPGIDVTAKSVNEIGIHGSNDLTALTALVRRGKDDEQILKLMIRLIDMGVDVNYSSSFAYKGNALCCATFLQPRFSTSQIPITILKHAGPELNLNHDGYSDLTAYRNMVISEHLAGVELILKRGACVEDIPVYGDNCGMLPTTIPHKDHDILDVIMKYGANKYGPASDTRMPLNFAMCVPEDAAWAEYFISKYKVDVNHMGAARTQGDVGAIHEAALCNNIKGLDVLFDHGAEVNLETSFAYTALQLAAGKGNLEAAEYLIHKGANMNGYNLAYVNAMTMAALGYHTDMLELLVKHGADVNEVSKGGQWAGPLAQVAMKFNPSEKKDRHKTIEKLLKLGANPDVLHAQDMTAIMCAAKLGTHQGRKAAVGNCDILIDHGANVNLVNTAGESTLMIAAAAGNLELVELLIESGAKVDIINKLNESALTYADRAPEDKSSIIKALKKAGAKDVVANSVASAISNGASTATSTTAPSSLVGTWGGYATANKITMTNFVINKDNTYSFSAVSKFQGQVISSISHKGTITATTDTYILKPEGQASATYSYEIINGMLVVNNGTPLNRMK